MPEPIRQAKIADLQELKELETLCYDPERRQSITSLKRSLTSTHQTVWVTGKPIHAALILWHKKKLIRIYGIHTNPQNQSTGIGTQLLNHAERIAKKNGVHRIVLEADADNQKLLAWYEKHGFIRKKFKPNFYANARNAYRLEKTI